jgi:2-succinyl-5-enolpyruvyl-6-hydroxy-3-cyclohexene-1-carboxylate synthase
LEIACNRGTSGIDGSTSTAVGVAVANKGQTLFITGDLSFFYDSNALWNSYIPTSFRIIVINNGGGGIFRFIPGPTTTHTLDYFETPHQLTAENLCKTHQISYESVSDIVSLEEKLRIFFNDSKQAKLLEIFTPKETNAEILKAYFNNL